MPVPGELRVELHKQLADIEGRVIRLFALVSVAADVKALPAIVRQEERRPEESVAVSFDVEHSHSEE